jgi:hypothetical protein
MIKPGYKWLLFWLLFFLPLLICLLFILADFQVVEWKSDVLLEVFFTATVLNIEKESLNGIVHGACLVIVFYMFPLWVSLWVVFNKKYPPPKLRLSLVQLILLSSVVTGMLYILLIIEEADLSGRNQIFYSVIYSSGFSFLFFLNFCMSVVSICWGRIVFEIIGLEVGHGR